MMSRRPLVAGGSVAPFRRYTDGSSWRDWVRRAASEALVDAELGIADIDAIVVASESDFLSMQVNPAPLIADDLGRAGVACLRVEGGGASGAQALRVAVMHILAGLYRRVLAVGFEQAASHLPGDTVRRIYGLSFDADIDGLAGVTAAELYALSISRHMAIHGTTELQMAIVSVKNHRNARSNPWAHMPMDLTTEMVLASPVISEPYKRLDCSALSDGAAALILCDPEAGPDRRDRPRVRVSGLGCASDFVRLGDRPEPHRFSAKERSAAAAYAMAGIADPSRQVDVLEVYDAFTGAEIQGLEALGVARPGTASRDMEEGRFNRDGPCPVNLSGGLIGQGGAPGAVGIAQAVTIARLLQGRYFPGLQPKALPRIGVADAHGGVCAVSVTHVFERLD
jgi:acetyl-CoA C-acetyltransferase